MHAGAGPLPWLLADLGYTVSGLGMVVNGYLEFFQLSCQSLFFINFVSITHSIFFISGFDSIYVKLSIFSVVC